MTHAHPSDSHTSARSAPNDPELGDEAAALDDALDGAVRDEHRGDDDCDRLAQP